MLPWEEKKPGSILETISDVRFLHPITPEQNWNQVSNPNDTRSLIPRFIVLCLRDLRLAERSLSRMVGVFRQESATMRWGSPSGHQEALRCLDRKSVV